MTDTYCTTDELAAELGISDGDDASMIESAIAAASRQIDAHCGQRFWQDTAVVTREFYAESSTCVDLLEQPGGQPATPISTTTGLIVKTDSAGSGTFGTTLTINTSFLLFPRNAAADGRPFTEIGAIEAGSFPILGSGRAGVQVTAKFGWPSVPDDVKKACLVQAAQLFASKDAVFGAVALGDSSAMYLRSALNSTAKALLAPYQRAVLG